MSRSKHSPEEKLQAVMDTECTKRRFQSYQHLVKEVTAWERKRNKKKAKVEWTFTREKADEKFSKYYTA